VSFITHNVRGKIGSHLIFTLGLISGQPSAHILNVYQAEITFARNFRGYENRRLLCTPRISNAIWTNSPFGSIEERRRRAGRFSITLFNMLSLLMR
jgi:hypothetical protein